MIETEQNPFAEEDEIDIRKVIQLVLENWYFFVASIGIGLLVSYAYSWYSQPVYEMTTTVMVEDQGNDISQNILDEVGVYGKKRNIENEIAILNSRNLMGKAMATLDLNIGYKVDKGLRTRDLYKNSPVELQYNPAEVGSESRFNMRVSINEVGDGANVELNHVTNAGKASSVIIDVVFGEPFQHEIGEFTLTKTEFFESSFNDESAIRNDYLISYLTDDQLTTKYQGKLKVEEARQKSSILRLRLQDNVSKRGVDILDAILKVYIQNNIEKKNQLASNSVQFIENQLDVISKELDSIESEIRTFKTNSGISDVSSESVFFLDQVGELDRKVSEIDVKLSIINYLKEYVRNNGNMDNASPSSLGIEDPLLQNLIAKLSELNAERESMLRFTQEDNPLVTSIDTKIMETKASLIENIESIKAGLLASKEEFGDQLKKVEDRVKNLPKAEYELLALQRQYSIKESLYLLLLENKSENSILLASTVSDNTVIDKARSSKRPIKPKKNLIYLIGLMVGMAIPSLYILIIILIDDRIKSLEDLKRASSIPFLGIVPHHTGDEKVVVHAGSNSAIGESFRSIRTNLAFMVRSSDLEPGVSEKVIQVTSAEGSEGKSFCSMNLAASVALGGSKTIVVGLDLRKPKLAEYFGVSNDVGASSVLAGLNTLKEATMVSDIENLDVLVAGPIPPNPSELLMSGALKDMLDVLAQDYDTIILDTPPIGLVTDSLIISEHAATTIYVVRQNASTTKGLTYINDLYHSKKIKSISLLFNDVKSSRFGYGYGYGYGYGAGYYAEAAPKGPLEKLKRLVGISS